jgi:hypothetical protein
MVELVTELIRQSLPWAIGALLLFCAVLVWWLA